MDHTTNDNQLNEFIQLIIQQNGMSYTVENYIQLRDQYYSTKCDTPTQTGGL